ncbi:MAG TPA: fenitrothion hydrolase [Solirubrobacteraceae bacterium]|nr:fenitrothion hydrolase [Solirubrobacteraceae bacterium]
MIVAHGIVGRADLPIPEWLFAGAAALVLAVSFAALAAGWTRPRLEEVRERPLLPLPLAVDVVLGAAGLAFFCLVVYAGFAGTGVQAANLAPTAVYVAFAVGVPVASLLLGDVFRLLSPWRAVGRAGGALVKRVLGPGASEPLPYPRRLGRWPAVAGLLAFAFVELIWTRGDDPQVLAICALVYFAVQLVGMGLYGVEAWSRNGDAFGVYFGLFASVAPFARRAGRLVVRAPLAGAAAIRRPPGTLALLVVAIGMTTFDGAREGVLGDLIPPLQDLFAGLGQSKGGALQAALAVLLAAAIAFVALVYRSGVAGMPREPGESLPPRFAHTLIPIAAAYLVAHYFSLLAYNGQSLLPLLSDPLGDGSDYLGAAGTAIDYGVISATGIWYVQVAALVLGHVGALVLAHDRALALYGSARDATRSQVVMLVVMIAFTSIGLWLLSVANQ